EQVAAQERVDLPFLAQERALDRRVVQQREAIVRIERQKTLAEDLSLHACMVRERLRLGLAELGDAGAGESPAEALDPHDADRLATDAELGSLPFEDDNTAVGQ